jgi:hypothetical protein
VLVVANNSSDAAKRRGIEEICQHHGTPHVHLPSNPEWHPCRSHGIAMNWLFFNVVTRLSPQIFGFIDHDCFPIQPYDVVRRMEGRDVFGVRRESSKVPGAWNLWAGFCFYRLSRLDPQCVDFKHRVEFGLDTGGGNWLGLYNSVAPERVATVEERILDQTDEARAGLSAIIDDAFLHVGGASFREGHLGAAADTIWKRYLGGCERRHV